MSVASPRDSLHAPRRPMPMTPTSSTRPSLDTPLTRSLTGSPNPPSSQTSNPTTSSTMAAPPKQRANRAALREYYNIKRATTTTTTTTTIATPPVLEVTDPLGIGTATSGGGSLSEVPAGELDAHGFDADAFVKKTLETSGLEELLRVYARVLGEMRALDAEKKALVYDNYSKLISATETIRKMRANMDPLNPMATSLDPTIAEIYAQASNLRESLRERIPRPEGTPEEELARRQRRDRTRQLARIAIDTPDRLRGLIADGRVAEAKEAWELPRKLLETWRERGLGGDDVQALIDQGDTIIAATQTPAETQSTDTQSTDTQSTDTAQPPVPPQRPKEGE